MTYEVQRTIIRKDGKKEVGKLMYTTGSAIDAQSWKDRHIANLKAMNGFQEYIYVNTWTHIVIMDKGQIIITIEKWNA